MTAIGFLILGVMFLVSIAEIVKSDKAKFVAGAAVTIGLLMVIAGTTAKLWEVMP